MPHTGVRRLDESLRTWIAHVGNGCVWGFWALGHQRWRVLSPSGLATTNIVLGGNEGRTLYVTQSYAGEILRA
ncbi:MAG: SMP-30/gluconolactonase/LRE family protein [Pseudomonadota bacterium]